MQPKDELDMMLEGEDKQTPSVSQTDNNSAGSNSDNPIEGTEGQLEEVEFNKLSGSAQERFQRILREKKEAQQEALRYKDLAMQSAQNGTQVPPPPAKFDPQVQEALGRLRQVGIATVDDVEQKINQMLATKSFYDELGKLESDLNGQDGRPKFVREEYEDYINRHPQYKGYLPRDVYNIMYDEELTDWKVSHRDQAPQKTQTLRPTRTASGKAKLTAEDIEEKLKSLQEPQRSEWYNQHVKEINDVLRG